MSFLSLRALAFVGISLMISACAGASGPARGPGEVGRLAPSLAIQSLNGKGAVSLKSLPGKVVIVQFWATWCETCKKSLTQLEEINKQSGGKVEVIGISVDDTTRGVADFAKAQGVTFPIAWDENHTLMWRWSIEKMPSTYILDSKGTVRFIHEAGKDDADLITREVAQLTSDGTVTSPKIEVASASVPIPPAPVDANVAATDAPSATPPADETSAPAQTEAAPTPKSTKKPGATKKGVTKKPTKKSAAPSKAAGT